MCMSRLAHNSEVDKFGTNVYVDNADYKGRNNNKREGSFLIGNDT